MVTLIDTLQRSTDELRHPEKRNRPDAPIQTDPAEAERATGVS